MVLKALPVALQELCNVSAELLNEKRYCTMTVIHFGLGFARTSSWFISPVKIKLYFYKLRSLKELGTTGRPNMFIVHNYRMSLQNIWTIV